MQRPTSTSIAPIFLRIALGATFLWAGLGKLEGEMKISGEPVAILANMGLHAAKRAAQPPVGAPVAEPVETFPPPAPTSAEPPSQPPVQPPPENPGEQPQTPPGGVPEVIIQLQVQESAQTPPLNPAQTGSPPPAPAVKKPVRIYNASEFPDQVEVKRVYGLALMIHRAANPTPRADGAVPSRLWPLRLSHGSWPLFFAWSVAVVEVAGGLFVLAGLLTRASAVGLAGVMLGALWLTEIGPAVRSGATALGFLPNHDWLDVEAWKSIFWQFSLLMAAVALAFLGSGALGLDRKIFPPAPPPPTNIKPLM